MRASATTSHVDESATYYTGLPDRSGMAQYTVLIRGPRDPERRSRAARRETEGAAASTSWRKLAKLGPPEWAARIVAHLADGVPRTFNRIMVELADVTADVVAGKSPEKGLWLAVAEERLAWTATAPVHFTAVGSTPAPAAPRTAAVADTRLSEGVCQGVQLTLEFPGGER